MLEILLAVFRETSLGRVMGSARGFWGDAYTAAPFVVGPFGEPVLYLTAPALRVEQ